MWPKLRRIAALMLCAGLLAGCAASAAPQHDPDTLVELIRADGATMNPMYAETLEDANVYSQFLFDGLSYVGPDYLPHPRLATSWSHSADGLHWTVDLRHDVRWSDGVPFTSKDVVFSYRLFLDPRAAFNDIGTVDYITAVTADGPYRVRFDLKHPSATFVLGALGEDLVPEHVLGAIPPDRQRFSSFGEHPVGTGPYVLQHWEHDSELVFVRNPYAWRKPKIARLDVRVIFNDQSEMEALANGSADLIDDVSFTQYKQLQRIAPNIVRVTFPSLDEDVAEVNCSRPGLSDVAVRQAMMYGYDREAIVKGLFDNTVDVPDSIITRAVAFWHTDNLPQYPYDPAKARALLDAAGWKPGPDGIRRKGNVRLSFEDLLNQGSALVTDMELTFISDMRNIGIDVRLRQLDFASTVSRAFDGNYDILADARGGIIDTDLTPLYASNQIPPHGRNTSRYSDPLVDRLLKEGLVELDPQKRRAIYDRVQAELARTLPTLFQYGRFASLAHDQRLHLPAKDTMQNPYLYYNIEDWTLGS
jgi:peptide/nickel transport system substrate-binding protein